MKLSHKIPSVNDLLTLFGVVTYNLCKPLKRDPDLWMIGNAWNEFLGNSKYLALHLEKCKNISVIFISNNPEVKQELNELDIRVEKKYSMKGLYAAMICGTVVTSFGIRPVPWFLTGGANFVNIWHGIPIKRIPSLTRGYDSIVYNSMIHCVPDGDISENHLATIFDVNDNKIFRTGWPRNEAIKMHQSDELAINEGVNTSFSEKLESEVSCLYAPTFRKKESIAEFLDFNKLNEQLKNTQIHIFLKLHPGEEYHYDADQSTNIHTIPEKFDLYPFLESFDLLITDYSSIIFDFLHTDEPIVLFRPDYDNYAKESGIYEQIDAMIPADRVGSESELVDAISGNLAEDTYAAERSDIKNKFVSEPRGACSRIVELVENQNVSMN